MRHKIVSVTCMSTLLLVMLTVILPLGHAFEWSPDMRITWDPGLDRFPSMVQTDDGRIWVVWASTRQEDNLDLYYKVYNESQVHQWSPATRLTTNQSADGWPSIMQALDGSIWVVWKSNRAGNGDIYFKTYNGSWSSEEPLITDLNDDRDPSVMQASDGTIWLVFASNRTIYRDIYYATSSDNGETWEESLLPASHPEVDDSDPSIMQASDGTIWLVWESSEDIFYVTHNGTSWSSEETVTTHHREDLHPSIMQAQDESIWVVWDSDRDSSPNDPYGNLYYNIYNGDWSGDTCLTTTTDDDEGPSILQAVDGVLWIAWSSWRYFPASHNQDIYYRTNSTTPENDVSIFSVSPRKPAVAQGEDVNIEVVARNKGTLTQTFEVSCYANSTLISYPETIEVPPGQLYPIIFTWNTTGANPGTYFIKGEVTSQVIGETSTDDNTYIDGTITVLVHDVAVEDVTTSQTIAYRFYTTVDIYVQVRNEGNFTESFQVKAYRNKTLIQTANVVDLPPKADMNVTFHWFTIVPYDIYTISANASKVPGEFDLADNSKIDGTVYVTVSGDVNGDGFVDEFDLPDIGITYGANHGSNPSPNWDPECDINGDGIIDVFDLSILGRNYGKTV